MALPWPVLLSLVRLGFWLPDLMRLVADRRSAMRSGVTFDVAELDCEVVKVNCEAVTSDCEVVTLRCDGSILPHEPSPLTAQSYHTAALPSGNRC